MIKLRLFFTNNDGTTAIQYAVIAGCIFLTIVGSLYAFGNGTQSLYNTTFTKIQNNLS